MRPLTMLAVGMVTALLLVACGSDSEQLSEEEFLAAANEICAVGNEETAALGDDFEVADDATEEDVQQFIEEEGPAFRDDVVSNIQGQISDVRDLNGPDDPEEELNPLLDQTSDEVDGIAQLGPEEFFEGEWEDGLSEVNPQLQALGLTTCGEDAE